MQIAILGSTGSIGKLLLNIIKKNKKNFEIVLLTANNNHKDLLKQTEEFNVKSVILSNKDSFEKFKKSYNNFYDNLCSFFWFRYIWSGGRPHIWS